MSKYILTDGTKAVSLTGVEGWSYFSGNAPKGDSLTYYSRVSAAFRAFNLKANTVANMPFVIMRGKTEYDTSAAWENKVGFLPNPSEWLRLGVLSYMAKNSIYNLLTSDAIGYRPKGIYNLTPYSCEPVLSADNTKLEYIQRTVGTRAERYAPDGKQIQGDTRTARLIYLWRLDHTTELLPSANTEADAIMNAAGVIYHADTWIKHFFERGGVNPMVIAMKGAVDPAKAKDEEEKWTNWYLGLRDRFRRIFRVVNADMLDVKAVGEGVAQLKDNPTYNQAIANIAMGTGMPLSLLMANSANYATSKEEKSTWYENDIIPLCNWLAYEYNRQIFEPLHLRLEFRPETLDPQQEDETERASAMMQYAGVLEKCPSKDVFMGLAAMMGLEIPEDLEAALESYYADKEQKEKEMQEQMQAGGYVVGSDGKPVPAQVQQDKPEEKEKEDEEPKEKKPVKWQPSIDELEEIRIYRKASLQRMKRGESLDFEYLPHKGGLPEAFMLTVKAKLLEAKTEDEVRAAFEVEDIETPNDIMALAAAINKLAERV